MPRAGVGRGAGPGHADAVGPAELVAVEPVVDERPGELQREGDGLAEVLAHLGEGCRAAEGAEEQVEVVVVGPGPQAQRQAVEPDRRPGQGTDLAPHRGAVGGEDPEHHGDRLGAMVDLAHLVEGRGGPFDLVGRQEVDHVGTHQLVGMPAEQVGDRGAGVEDGAVGSEYEERMGGGVDQGPEQPVGDARRLVCPSFRAGRVHVPSCPPDVDRSIAPGRLHGVRSNEDVA